MQSPGLDPTRIAPPPLHEISENRANGHGYWMFTPDTPVTFDEGLPHLREYGDFKEMPTILDTLASSRALLVEGEPGSGKSHLVRDIQTGCVINGIPAFCLTTHVNSGSRQGAANAKEALNSFREKTKTSGGIVILDNIDVVGYRGKSKTRSLTTEYVQTMKPIIEELVADPKLVVLGTVHDNEWRKGRWTWNDENIDKPAQAILEAFPARMVFDGSMALVGLAHILQLRSIAGGEASPVSLGVAAQVMRQLHASGRANFFNANHIPINLFLQDPAAAIAQIDAGRTERRGKA